MAEDDGVDLSCFDFVNSDEEAPPTESLAQMTKRHRQEEQAIRTEAKARKHAIHKSDKSARASADAQLEASLEEMRQRHAQELFGHDEGAAMSKLSIQTEDCGGKLKSSQGSKSKADKRRAKKEAEEQERERRIREHHSGSGPSERDLEIKSISQQLSPLGLQILDIPADGHCLYRSIAQQLDRGSDAYAECRKTAATYIRSHPNDFLPFLAAEGVELNQYCETVEHSNEWGGTSRSRKLSPICTSQRPSCVLVTCCD